MQRAFGYRSRVPTTILPQRTILPERRYRHGAEKRQSGKGFATIVIITLPAYNEEQTLPLLLERTREAMQENQIDYRVIVVNDGSTDATADSVDEMAQSMPITRVDHEMNRGLGEAIRTGLIHAIEGADERDSIGTR